MYLSLSSAAFSASSSFCRAVASRSWARSNSSSTSWMRLFRAATSPSACMKHPPRTGLHRSLAAGNAPSSLKTATASPWDMQGSSGALLPLLFCLLKLWYLRNVKVWSVCLLFFLMALIIPATQKGTLQDCKWIGVFLEHFTGLHLSKLKK